MSALKNVSVKQTLWETLHWNHESFAFLRCTLLSAPGFKSSVYMLAYSVSLPFVRGRCHFQTFVSAWLDAAPASFLTIKHRSGKETGWECKDETRDGWKEQEVHSTEERREDVSGTVATVMINKSARGAETECLPQWICEQHLHPVYLTGWWHLHRHSFAESDPDFSPSPSHPLAFHHHATYNVAALQVAAAESSAYGNLSK